MKIEMVPRTQATCMQCSHKWFLRNPEKPPIYCPKCHSTYWWRRRKPKKVAFLGKGVKPRVSQLKSKPTKIAYLAREVEPKIISEKGEPK